MGNFYYSRLTGNTILRTKNRCVTYTQLSTINLKVYEQEISLLLEDKKLHGHPNLISIFF